MKKIISLFLTIYLTIISVNILANNNTKKQVPKKTNWSVFELSIFPTVPSSPYVTDVYGLKLGLPVSGGIKSVYGLETSVIGSGTDYIEGAQISVLANVCKTFYGLQLAFINIANEYGDGIQGGFFNTNSFDFNGLQLGAFNLTGKKADGLAVGVYNFAATSDGVQVGLLNISNKSGLQFGLVNIIKDSPIPFMPLCNFSF
jgi:hypothetical protein